jgi:hypothetical protein
MKPNKPISTENEDRWLKEQFGQENSFPVPENYFDELPTIIQEKLSNALASPKDRRFRYDWKWIPVASLIVIGIIFIGYRAVLQPKATPEICQTEIPNLLNEIPENLTAFLIMQFPENFYLNTLSEQEAVYADSVLLSKTLIPEGVISNEDIIDYLIFHQSAFTLLDQ